MGGLLRGLVTSGGGAAEENRDLPGESGEPARDDERREAKQQARQKEQDDPGEYQLRKADLGEQASGYREQGSPLRAGCVVLDVTEARINKRPHETVLPRSGSPPTALPSTDALASAVHSAARHDPRQQLVTASGDAARVVLDVMLAPWLQASTCIPHTQGPPTP